MKTSKSYITTSIPYSNAAPHLGHALEFIYGDILARYQRQRGVKNVLFSTGADEHGTKNAEKAAELGKSPKEFVEQNTQAFIDLLKKLEISNDRFIRTTDANHGKRAQLIWQKLAKDIEKRKYVGQYCVGCEAFVTETEAKDNKNECPIHKKAYQKLEEENYFFLLSKYAPQIKEAIVDGTFNIIPQTRKNEIMSLINEGLHDISISRPVEKLSWGVPVPGDPHQVMYVWFEALLNYITVLGYPEHEDFATYWPADVQVVGKDIARFHAAFWPGILLSLGLPLPKKLYIHGFITLKGEKMSKSEGKVVDPNEIIDKYGVDAFRYFLARHIPSYGDGDFSWERMDEVYNNELANDLGNAVQRVAAMVGKYQDNIIGDIPPPEHDVHEYQLAMDNCRFDKALEEVWEQVRGLNQYIDTQKPWELAKTKDDNHLREVLAYAVSNLLEIAQLLQSFMPSAAKKIQYAFSEGVVRPLGKPLFPKFEEKK